MKFSVCEKYAKKAKTEKKCLNIIKIMIKYSHKLKEVVEMINIRPVSDLRNNFTEIEKIVREGEPVYLTKNGYGTMVVMAIEYYAALTDEIEMKLDEAEKAAQLDDTRYTEDEVFGRIRRKINEL